MRKILFTAIALAFVVLSNAFAFVAVPADKPDVSNPKSGSILPVANAGTGAITAAGAWYNLSENGKNGGNASFIGYCAAKSLDCANGDQTTNLQNFLLAAQTVLYSQIGGSTNVGTLGSVFIKATVEPDNLTISSPLICPANVDCDIRGMLLPNSTATLVAPCTSTNWDGSSCGALNNLYEPMFIQGYGSRVSHASLWAKNGNGSNPRTGAVIGRTWEVGAIASIGAGGSGYTDGEIAYLAKPMSSEPSTKVTVHATGGSITSLTMSSSTRWNGDNGSYQLPPALQILQWASPDFISATGYTTFGSAGAGCYKILGQTSSASNACAYVSWWPDWCSGSAGGSGTSSYISCTKNTLYAGIYSNASSAIDTEAKNITVTQGGVSKDTNQYGAMFSVLNASMNSTLSGRLTVQNGYYGYYSTGIDSDIDTVNSVASSYGYIIPGGQQHYNKIIVDTPTAGCGIIGSYSGGSLSIGQQECFGNASSSALTDYAWNYGTGSGTLGVVGLNIGNSIITNTGATKAGMFIDYWQSGNWVNHVVSNFKGNGAATALPTSVAFEFGTHNKANGGNVITGLIDGAAGSIYTGTWPAGFRSIYWDAYANGWIFANGSYSLWGTAAPTSGASGTAVNKAGIGSTLIDTANGKTYINRAAAASPLWVSTSTQIVAQSGAQIINTGNSTSAWCLAAITLPPMGDNDKLELDTLWSSAGTATNHKYVSGRLSTTPCVVGTASSPGTSIFSVDLNSTSLVTVHLISSAWNRGATNSQVFFSAQSSSGIGNTAEAPVTAAVQTNGALYLNFTCTTADSTSDTCSLEGYTIKYVGM
jgi:hypothetical protein